MKIRNVILLTVIIIVTIIIFTVLVVVLIPNKIFQPCPRYIFSDVEFEIGIIKNKDSDTLFIKSVDSIVRDDYILIFKPLFEKVNNTNKGFVNLCQIEYILKDTVTDFKLFFIKENSKNDISVQLNEKLYNQVMLYDSEVVNFISLSQFTSYYNEIASGGGDFHFIDFERFWGLEINMSQFCQGYSGNVEIKIFIKFESGNMIICEQSYYVGSE